MKGTPTKNDGGERRSNSLFNDDSVHIAVQKRQPRRTSLTEKIGGSVFHSDSTASLSEEESTSSTGKSRYSSSDLLFGFGSKKRKDSSMKRRVHFDDRPPRVHIIQDHVRDRELSKVWYRPDYLKLARLQEIKRNLVEQERQNFNRLILLKNNKGQPGLNNQMLSSHDAFTSIESDLLSWRGMEHIRDNHVKRDNTILHAQAVVHEYQRLTSHRKLLCMSKKRVAVELAQYSKKLTKKNKKRAIQLAALDAKVVQGEREQYRHRHSIETTKMPKTQAAYMYVRTVKGTMKGAFHDIRNPPRRRTTETFFRV